MRIAHVTDSMEVGGAEMLVSQMCRLQRDRGHDPRVYVVGTLGKLGEQLQTEGFKVQANMGRHFPNALLDFFRIFKESRPDVVHLHNPTPTAYAAMVARMAGVPCIVSTRHNLAAPPRRRVAELRYVVTSSFCDWIVGICDATVNNLKSAHGAPARKIVRVYNGAAPLSHAPKEQWPQKLGFTLVYVGRFSPVKNLPLLFRAFHAALSSAPGLRLWMVGDGPERKALERLASELGITAQVTFWGQQLDVAPYFSAADAFIMSSTSEGLPISLLQAFSLGLPAIVTDAGGMAEVVRMCHAGMTVSPTDPAEMAAAILRLADNSLERAQFSEQAEAAFRQRFTLQTMVDAYMDLYRNTRRARRAATLREQP